MRFKYDPEKDLELRNNPRRGIGFDDVQEIWDHPHTLDRSSDWPEQYRSIGWVRGRLFTVIFEIRTDAEGEYYHLVTLWRATEQERELYEENF